MIYYQLCGTHKDGDEWDFPTLYKTRERAQAQMGVEIKAYTFNGVCDWVFDIIEVEIKE